MLCYLRAETEPWTFVHKSENGAIGLVPLLTAMFSFCPAYLPFGLSTCATPAEKTE
ncbi:MAG: DUF2892 domain-containing protein [Pseudomonadota bacterium]